MACRHPLLAVLWSGFSERANCCTVLTSSVRVRIAVMSSFEVRDGVRIRDKVRVKAVF